MLDLRDLERFLEIVRHRNFGRAAAALGMSQPPLSRHIANLERELGVTLFSREHRQIELTPAGTVFAREARALLAQARAAELMARDAARSARRRLRLGFPGSLRYRVLPAAVRRLLEIHPDAFVTLAEPSRFRHLDGLHAGALDLVLVRGPYQFEGLQVEYLRGDPLIAVVPADHALASKSAIAVVEFEGLPTIELGRQEGLGYHELVRGVYAQAGFVPRVVQEVDAVETLISCVAAGIGVGMVHDIAADLPIPDVAYRPLAPEGPSVGLAAMWRMEDANPLVPVFLDCLREVITPGIAQLTS